MELGHLPCGINHAAKTPVPAHEPTVGDLPGGEDRSLEVSEDVRTVCTDSLSDTNNLSDLRSSGSPSVSAPESYAEKGCEGLPANGLDVDREAGMEPCPPIQERVSLQETPQGKPTLLEGRHFEHWAES